MNKDQLTAFLAENGLALDGIREGAGKFRDLEIGTGASRIRRQTLSDIIGERIDKGQTA